MAGDHENEGDVPRLDEVPREGEDINATLVELEQMSLYDSLLHAVAAGTSQLRSEAEGTSKVRINAEVGPNGKFVLLQKIGSGAMGRVYRALDRYLLRDVAIKFILRPEGMDQDDFMALFWQEAHIIARLDQHDNIVRILDVDRSTYPPFIVMEYLDGQSLEGRIRRGPLDVPTTLQLMIGVACGLGEAHAKGVCHRDLKPSNIFIQKTGRVKLLDFGLARIRNHLFESSTTKARFVTARSVPLLASAGTPAYMAPEQWRGEDADASTDLWAMGAILYRLLTRRPAFDADSIAALSDRVLSGELPIPISALCPDAPLEICELTQRLLRFDRAERPRSLSEVIAVLESTLNKTQHPSFALAATQLLPNPIFDASGRDHRFAHGTGRDGALRHWEGMLLIMVHGPDSGSRISLDDIPSWIFKSAGVHCDVLQCPPQSDDVADSALRLRAYLNERIKHPRHIFFLTHGEGTDVVLRMLLDEAWRLRRYAPDGDRIQLDARSLFYRTRHVAILRPGRGVATAHHVAALHPRSDSSPLAAELMAEAQHFVAATLPTPAIHYFGIDEGGAPLHAGAPQVKSLAAFLIQPEMMLVRETISQSFALDCAARIQSLVMPADDTAAEDTVPTVPGARAGTQGEVFDELLVLARSQHQRLQTVAITGDAGVGKSTVLRMVARHLSGELITDGGAVLPLLLPLYFASLTSEQLAVLDAAASGERGRVFLDLVLDWSCDWFNSITYAGALEPDWIKARLRAEPMVLILDGVDEFIANHPTVRIADFQQMLAFLGTEYRRNGWLTVVLGVRSSQPGLPALGSNNTREVLRLTTSQAIRHFPAAASWLGADSGAPIRKLLFTPLILAQLNTRRSLSPPRPGTPRPSTRDELILLALTAIIEQSDLGGKLDAKGQPIDAHRWIDALMATAWCLFRRLRGEIATGTLRSDGAELHRSWHDHLERTEQQTRGEQLLSGFHLLCESRAFDALLCRTVLYPTGRDEVRFIHREWQDFLAARYLAHVVVYRHVDEFRHVGNTARISHMAGELLCRMGVCIDEALIVALLRHAHETGARLITANFAALLTNSQVPIDGPAIDALLSAVSAMPAIARTISLTGLGYRALRGDDASAQDLRHRLVRVFRDYLTVPILDSDLGVMRSIAWCYRKAYAQRFGGPVVTDPWPGLHDADERAVLSMMCSISPDGPRFLAEHRSVQIALLEVQQDVAGDPCRPISGVHYLYCLAVARRHGGGIAELSRELPALLAPGSPYATAIESYDQVPELREVLAACRRLDLAP